jgi:cellulose biosynthesis protein BcsQ
MPPRPQEIPPFRIVTIASNKGGVGKTTVATNLAIYARALREELPVLLLGFDDQSVIDRMLEPEGRAPGRDMLEAVRSGDLGSAIRLGQYGVHYVPTSPAVGELKSELREPLALRELLLAAGWSGLVIVDTKSDLELLTRSALAASDLAILPVADQTSLGEAGRIFALLESWDRPPECARVLLSLVDRRIKYRDGESADVLALLVAAVRRRGHPLFETFVSRSWKVESLVTNPEERARSILHGAKDSLVHSQMLHLFEEVMAALETATAPTAPTAEPPPQPQLIDVEELLGGPQVVPAEAKRRECRRGARRPLEQRVSLFREAEPSILVLRARDVSETGIGLEGHPVLRPGERLHVALGAPDDEPTLVWARVVRSDRNAGTALEFE